MSMEEKLQQEEKEKKELEERLQQARKAKKELQVQAKNDRREKLQLQGQLRDQEKEKKENVELQAKVLQLQEQAGPPLAGVSRLAGWPGSAGRPAKVAVDALFLHLPSGILKKLENTTAVYQTRANYLGPKVRIFLRRPYLDCRVRCCG